MADEVVAVEKSEVVDFVYSVEGDSQLDLNELVPVLTALGEVIQEANRVLNPDAGDIHITVKPFEKGSFPIELLLSQDAQNTLYAAYQAGGITAIIGVLKTIGLIRAKVKEYVSLLDLLKKLNGQPPQEIRPVENGKKFEVTGHDNQVTNIDASVNIVLNNPTITGDLTQIFAPLDKAHREKIQSFIKGDDESRVEVTRQEAPALKEIALPVPANETPRESEHTNVVFLNPKRGSFEGEGDKWTFRKGGRQGEIIKANIKDQKFLQELVSGEKRLNGGDVLTVELHEKQKVVGSQIHTTNDILKVLDYKPAPNGPKQTSLFDGLQN